MGRKKFVFDPDSHQFIEFTRTARDKFTRVFLIFLAAVLVVILIRFSPALNHLDPVLTRLDMEQGELLARYDSLEGKIQAAEQTLSGMQFRDDNLYRCVCKLDPIPRSVREVGLGGSSPYYYLPGYEVSRVMTSASHGLDILELKAVIQQKSFGDLMVKATDRKGLIAARPSIHPIPLDIYHWISSDFGYRLDPVSQQVTEHHGLDIAALRGTRVYATGDGTVLLTRYSRTGYGKEVVIDHGFGYTSRYAHLNSILVQTGQKVRRGSLIGTLGNSGKSTGPHLHYEVRLYNRPMNPRLYYADDLLPREYHQIVHLANSSDN